MKSKTKKILKITAFLLIIATVLYYPCSGIYKSVKTSIDNARLTSLGLSSSKDYINEKYNFEPDDLQLILKGYTLIFFFSEDSAWLNFHGNYKGKEYYVNTYINNNTVEFCADTYQKDEIYSAISDYMEEYFELVTIPDIWLSSYKTERFGCTFYNMMDKSDYYDSTNLMHILEDSQGEISLAVYNDDILTKEKITEIVHNPKINIQIAYFKSPEKLNEYYNSLSEGKTKYFEESLREYMFDLKYEHIFYYKND